MPRVNTVDKARKSPGKCGGCGKAIEVGQGYRWAKGRYGPKMVRCLAAACHFRPSHLTSSDKLSQLYAAREAVEDALAEEFSADEVRSALEDAANEAREVGGQYREAADNIESGMNARMPQCDELEEKADACEEWADTLEAVEVEVEDIDGEEGESEEERIESWRDGVRAEVQEALDSLSL